MPKASNNPTQRPRQRPSQLAPEPRPGRDRLERVLAILVIVFGAIALVGFAATMLHVALRDSIQFFAGVAWQYAYWLPLVALPLMILCVVALVISNASGKARRR
ncbi:hypothetical protein [Agrococcus sp. Ld7]|uniref:hypothetical protein n=1 Tax=Agrococcus sp. Ld7 TaxID=649148 RepID=UPI003865F51F